MSSFGRRDFVAALLALLAARRLAGAQAPGRLAVIGILSPHRKPPPEFLAHNPIITRLRELGWVPDLTCRFERAYAEGREDRMPELAATLVAKKVDVIWANGPEAAVAAARATKTIPIVFWGVPFPVEQGLIDSLARPGRNVTGVAWYAGSQVDAKRLQLLREVAPKAKRLARITVPSAGYTVSGAKLKVPPRVPAAARRLGFEYRSFPVLRVADFAPAFEAILHWGAQALMVMGTTLTVREKDRIVDFARDHRLPAVYTLREFVEAGGLVAYAIDLWPTLVRSFEYVDRVLRGAWPADLPVELPSRYELAINLETAKALGLSIPQSLLLRADRIIR